MVQLARTWTCLAIIALIILILVATLGRPIILKLARS